VVVVAVLALLAIGALMKRNQPLPEHAPQATVRIN
jgi:hypothetical protein